MVFYNLPLAGGEEGGGGDGIRNCLSFRKHVCRMRFQRNTSEFRNAAVSNTEPWKIDPLTRADSSKFEKTHHSGGMKREILIFGRKIKFASSLDERNEILALFLSVPPPLAGSSVAPSRGTRFGLGTYNHNPPPPSPSHHSVYNIYLSAEAN